MKTILILAVVCVVGVISAPSFYSTPPPNRIPLGPGPVIQRGSRGIPPLARPARDSDWDDRYDNDNDDDDRYGYNRGYGNSRGYGYNSNDNSREYNYPSQYFNQPNGYRYPNQQSGYNNLNRNYSPYYNPQG
uniref:Uncharacterized protein n=1 Tax=Panagrolaimus sp. JU765 TaxID=591449 RepID=A0AC34RNW1_9BILA